MMITPKGITATFVGGPWDGKSEGVTMDSPTQEIPPTWTVRVGGEGGEIVSFVYHLARMIEKTNDTVEVVYQALGA
jgi:hypothetical protein